MSSDLVKRLRAVGIETGALRTIEIQAADRIEALEAALAEATRLMTEASREAGEWKGKYEAAGYPGTLDGWIERAKALEVDNARLGAAATALYHAAHWTPDRPCDAVQLWAELRDAIGLPHGTAPKPKGQSDE